MELFGNLLIWGGFGWTSVDIGWKWLGILILDGIDCQVLFWVGLVGNRLVSGGLDRKSDGFEWMFFFSANIDFGWN